MHSPNLAEQNIDKIAALFPNCITEAKDDDGKLRTAIDFDLLRQELSREIVDGPQERYQLNWPGKREALLTANTPIAKTLRPCREESVNFDTTENLFIEGDNLDALKMLQETYLEKIKVVYIDPPYNTGRDFIYSDDFRENANDFLKKSHQTDQAGSQLVANLETNGRFHSDWLTMMYPRLKLTRNLLTDDGVVFISIDDNEVDNVRHLCNEIFGQKNFIAQILWKKRSTPPNDKIIGANHDYILLFSKDISSVLLQLKPRSLEQISRYKNPDNHPKGPWTPGDLMANVKGGRYVESLYYPITNPRTGEKHFPSNKGNWRFNDKKIQLLQENDEIYFGQNDNGRPKLKRFLKDVKNGVAWPTIWDFSPLNTRGSTEMGELFGNTTAFENPKPVGLIKDILNLGGKGIVLDFFAGSATTAHAVMDLNLVEHDARRYIMIQLPEDAEKSEYSNIAEISKERIRRAGQKILTDNPDKNGIENLDFGFRVLKVDSSNMSDVFYNPDQIIQGGLFDNIDNVKADRTEEDLLFQVMLDWGVDLTLSIRRETIGDKTVFFVDNNSLVACFDNAGGVDDSFVKSLAAFEPLRVVFRDGGFANDSAKINVEQIFKQLSPTTDVKAI